MKIDLASTFLLSDALSRGALRVEPRMHLDEMAVLRGQPERKPLEFVHAEGRRRLDLVGTGYAMLYLVSDRFIDVLSGAKFTGWTTYPVRIVDESGHEVSGYHGLSVRGRSGALDPERAE